MEIQKREADAETKLSNALVDTILKNSRWYRFLVWIDPIMNIAYDYYSCALVVWLIGSLFRNAISWFILWFTDSTAIQTLIHIGAIVAIYVGLSILGYFSAIRRLNYMTAVMFFDLALNRFVIACAINALMFAILYAMYTFTSVAMVLPSERDRFVESLRYGRFLYRCLRRDTRAVDYSILNYADNDLLQRVIDLHKTQSKKSFHPNYIVQLLQQSGPHRALDASYLISHGGVYTPQDQVELKHLLGRGGVYTLQDHFELKRLLGHDGVYTLQDQFELKHTNYVINCQRIVYQIIHTRDLAAIVGQYLYFPPVQRAECPIFATI
jgi:hypothetical protein